MFALASCKAKSSAYKNAYDQAQAKGGDENWDADEDDTETLKSEEVSYDSFKKENLKPHADESASKLKRYSVVIGSFKNSTNAYSLKERMQDEGYDPVVAENDYGMLRVIVSSFNSKADAARSRESIKEKYYPNFQDAWLLERQ